MQDHLQWLLFPTQPGKQQTNQELTPTSWAWFHHRYSCSCLQRWTPVALTLRMYHLERSQGRGFQSHHELAHHGSQHIAMSTFGVWHGGEHNPTEKSGTATSQAQGTKGKWDDLALAHQPVGELLPPCLLQHELEISVFRHKCNSVQNISSHTCECDQKVPSSLCSRQARALVQPLVVVLQVLSHPPDGH